MDKNSRQFDFINSISLNFNKVPCIKLHTPILIYVATIMITYR